MKNFIEKIVIVKVVLSTWEKKCRQLWRISSSKNPSFFCLKSGKIQIFFRHTEISSQNVALYFLITVWTPLFKTFCPKLKKNWNNSRISQKKPFCYKSLFWITTNLPYHAREEKYLSERFAILKKRILKSITLVRLPWNEFSKSLLFNFVTVYKQRNLFAFQNLKICRTVIFKKTRLCLPKKTSLT